jgi:5-methylthioadenosine/S-adenosylhomocysteine deaminase
MSTREGARAIGAADLGSIEPGKRADLILVERDRPHLAPDADVWSTVVYAARGTDVRLTMVDGHILVRDFALINEEVSEITSDARGAAATLVTRSIV